MTDRRRYTSRANPQLADGTVSLTFRCPTQVAKRLDEIVATGRPGIDNRTDALQDAVVVWLLVEEADMNGSAP